MLAYLKKIIKVLFEKLYRSVSLNKIMLILIGCLIVIKQYFYAKNIIPEISMSEFLRMLKM